MLILFSKSDTQLERVVILFVCSARWYEDGVKSVFSWHQNMFLCVSFLCRRYCSEQHSPHLTPLTSLGHFLFCPEGFFLSLQQTKPNFLSLVYSTVGSWKSYCSLCSPPPPTFICLLTWWSLGFVFCFFCGDLYTCVSFGKRKCKS